MARCPGSARPVNGAGTGHDFVLGGAGGAAGGDFVARTGRGGCRRKTGDGFSGRSWAPGAGARRIPGDVLWFMSHGGASEASAKGGRWPTGAGRGGQSPTSCSVRRGPPPGCGKGLVDLVELQGPAPAPGDPGGRCFRRGRLPRPGGGLGQGERFCSSAGGRCRCGRSGYR